MPSSAIRHHKILHVRRTIDRFNAKENKMHSILGALLFVTVMALSVLGKDTHRNCAEWARMGECENNPDYMLANCDDTCKYHAEEALRNAEDIKDITSFFDLEANDIDGTVVHFAEFKGKVTVVVNVASYCGYTESHYNGLVALYNELKDTGVVEIIAFPCNQFGAQEPEECPTIKRFAEKKGVEFRMMDKIDVNGPKASKVYKYLKKESGITTITWNFAAYFVVGPEGNVQGFTGVEPHELKGTIGELIDKEL